MEIFKFFIKQFRHLYFSIKTSTFKGRIKYIYENHSSDRLIIAFAAFSDKPAYNYYRTLKRINVDKLFLQDNFGYKGSYLLYEDGTDLPLEMTLELIKNILTNKKYRVIVTLGTSKGGSDAIIFGLLIGATEIYSGANQYYIGKYLNVEGRRDVFKAMMGKNADKVEQDILDSVMPDLIDKYKNSKSRIHLLYSKEEHTYNEHIKYMIDDLKKTNIKFEEIVEHFENHNDVGRYFSQYIFNQLKQILKSE